MRLLGARAMVSGATGGVGAAIANALVREGCQLTITGRDRRRLAELARTTRADSFPADLTDPQQRQALVDHLPSGLELVVLAAGVGCRAPLREHSPDAVRRLIDVNLTSQIELTSLMVPLLTRGGRLVVVGSIAGRLGVAGESVYAAAKAGLEVFATSLSVECRAAGIGVTLVSPGPVDTGFFTRRGTPYERRFPRPIGADRVARATVRALRHDRDEVLVPGWLRLPVVLRALAPRTYGRAAGRWG
jgi:short-subunit dehydrogenase